MPSVAISVQDQNQCKKNAWYFTIDPATKPKTLFLIPDFHITFRLSKPSMPETTTPESKFHAVIARDGTDHEAPARRLAAREAHLALARQMKAEGKIIHAGALLGDDRRMTGSLLVVSFASRAELDDWLAADPYVTGGLWRQIEVFPFQPAPL